MRIDVSLESDIRYNPLNNDLDPIGGEKFFSLSRQSKCIPIVATQSISSLKSTLSGDSYRTLLRTFRIRIFLAPSYDFSTPYARREQVEIPAVTVRDLLKAAPRHRPDRIIVG